MTHCSRQLVPDSDYPNPVDEQHSWSVESQRGWTGPRQEPHRPSDRRARRPPRAAARGCPTSTPQPRYIHLAPTHVKAESELIADVAITPGNAADRDVIDNLLATVWWPAEGRGGCFSRRITLVVRPSSPTLGLGGALASS